MAGDHGKRVLSPEELERQRKQEEEAALEDIRRRLQEDDNDIPEDVYRLHVQLNPIDDVVLPNIPGNIPGTDIDIYGHGSLDPSHFMMFLDDDGNPRVDLNQECVNEDDNARVDLNQEVQSGQQPEEQYHHLGEDQEGDQHDDEDEEVVMPQPRIKLRRGRREKSGSGQTVRVRSKYFLNEFSVYLIYMLLINYF